MYDGGFLNEGSLSDSLVQLILWAERGLRLVSWLLGNREYFPVFNLIPAVRDISVSFGG
jgi:hypothetical protein